MGFLVLAKHGLNLKKGFKTNLVSFWTTKKKTGMKRGEGEKEKSKQSQAPKRYGTTNLEYGTTNLEYGTWIFGMDPWFCLVNGYLLYPNLGFVRISS